MLQPHVKSTQLRCSLFVQCKALVDGANTFLHLRSVMNLHVVYTLTLGNKFKHARIDKTSDICVCVKLAHMDLKSSKILLREKNCPVAKIGNLGLSVSIIEEDVRKKQQIYRQVSLYIISLYLPCMP